MSVLDAFISSSSHDLFASVAAPADAAELVELDVPEGQREARAAIRLAISNAVTGKGNPGRRIALVLGESGSGKTHVVTTAFGYASQGNEVLPAIVQLTAPVSKDGYLLWLVEATVRELESRHFPDGSGSGPLKRLAHRLLSLGEVEDREALLAAVEQDDDLEAIRHAVQFARKIRRALEPRLKSAPPGAAFLGALILGGLGNFDALHYLRRGEVRSSLADLGLDASAASTDRLQLLADLGLAAQGVGCALAIALDQVENMSRMGDEMLAAHAIRQAVRIAERIPNVAIVIAGLQDAYDQAMQYDNLASDRHRIEAEEPKPVLLQKAEPELIRNVIARRLALMRKRSGVPAAASGSLDPLPEWFEGRLTQRSVRAGLLEVNRFRAEAVKLGRLPTREEIDSKGGAEPGVPEPTQATDFEKLWADFIDKAPAVRERLLPGDRGELLRWWLGECGSEHSAPIASQVELVNGAIPTVDLLFSVGQTLVERRRVGLCEAPNRNNQLLHQLDEFLSACDNARPVILRTNGFPQGPRSQPAAAIRRVRDCDGFVLGLAESEWHLLLLAREFWQGQSSESGFAEWRKGRRWLLDLLPPLRELIEPPTIAPSGLTPETPIAVEMPIVVATGGSGNTSTFPVYIGDGIDGVRVLWDPYRETSPKLNNFGFLVTGDAGSGKTQTIRVLIDAAARAALPVCIFDFKNDYASSDFAGVLGLTVVDVRERGLPFNPLRPPPHGASGSKPIDHAFEIAGILKRVYRLGAIQENALRDAISSTYTSVGIDVRDWVVPGSRAWPSFSDVEQALLQDQRRNGSLIARLAPLFQLGLFPHDGQAAPFEQILGQRIVLKLNELPTDEIKAALAEFIIVQLHGYALRGDQPRRLTRLMVFDEAHRIKTSPRLEALGREGRAFGVGIVLGTQYPGDIPEATAGALATQLFLLNNQADHRRHVVRQVLGTVSGVEAQRLMQRLGELEPGQGLFTNPHHSRAFVTVLPHWKRIAPP